MIVDNRNPKSAIIYNHILEGGVTMAPIDMEAPSYHSVTVIKD